MVFPLTRNCADCVAADDPPTTISLYPPATARGLRLVLVGAAVFFVTASVFRTAPQIKRLLLIVFVIGCAEALLAVMQIFTRTNRMYWVADFNLPRLTSGSFVNYSNFCQFMNLSIGAGFGLLLVRLQGERRHGAGGDAVAAPGAALEVEARLGDAAEQRREADRPLRADVAASPAQDTVPGEAGCGEAQALGSLRRRPAPQEGAS